MQNQKSMYRFPPTNRVSTVQIRSGAVEGRKKISWKPESRWVPGPCGLSTKKILKLGEQDLGNGNCRFAWVNYVFRKMLVATGACVLFWIFFWSQKRDVHLLLEIEFCIMSLVLCPSLWEFSFSWPYHHPFLILFFLLFQSQKYLLIFNFLKCISTHWCIFPFHIFTLCKSI